MISLLWRKIYELLPLKCPHLLQNNITGPANVRSNEEFAEYMLKTLGYSLPTGTCLTDLSVLSHR